MTHEFDKGDVIVVIGSDIRWVVCEYQERWYSNCVLASCEYELRKLVPWKKHGVFVLQTVHKFNSDFIHKNAVKVGTWDFSNYTEVE